MCLRFGFESTPSVLDDGARNDFKVAAKSRHSGSHKSGILELCGLMKLLAQTRKLARPFAALKVAVQMWLIQR